MSLMPVDAITLITHQVSLFGPQHGMVEEGDKVAPDHLLRLHDRIGAWLSCLTLTLTLTYPYIRPYILYP